MIDVRSDPGPPSGRRSRGLAPRIGKRHVIAEVDVPRVAREQRPVSDRPRDVPGAVALHAGPTFHVRVTDNAGTCRTVSISQRSSPGRSPARTGTGSGRSMGRVLRSGCSLTMPGDVGRASPDGQRSRAQVTGLFVPDVDGLTGRIATDRWTRASAGIPGCCATTCTRPRTRRPGSQKRDSRRR